MGSGNGTTQKKLSAAQRAERIKAAQEREERAAAKREAASRTKKIFTIVVCVILVLALSIPTMALTVLNVGA
jgi:cell division protein FtsL